jgi:hypothetical protein
MKSKKKNGYYRLILTGVAKDYYPTYFKVVNDVPVAFYIRDEANGVIFNGEEYEEYNKWIEFDTTKAHITMRKQFHDKKHTFVKMSDVDVFEEFL